MTYKEAMEQKCRCGRFLIGGWFGKKRLGRPNFSRVSCQRVLSPSIIMGEEHTLDACYAPQEMNDRH